MMPETNRRELQEVWRVLFRMTPPPEQSWLMWETYNTSADVREAILQLALKHKQCNGEMTSDHMVKFVSSVLHRINKQKRETIQKLKSSMSALAVTATVTVADDADDNRGNRC